MFAIMMGVSEVMLDTISTSCGGIEYRTDLGGDWLAITRLFESHRSKVPLLVSYSAVPLWHACIDHDFTEILPILERTSRLESVINAPGDDGSPYEGDAFLHIASRRGYLEVCSWLLDRGADVNQPNKRGRTALHEASAIGSASLLHLFLQNGADVGWRDVDGNNAANLASNIELTANPTRDMLHKAMLNAEPSDSSEMEKLLNHCLANRMGVFEK